MAQVEVYLKGELDYSKISGPTGPLVYPAGHLRLHTLLHTLTDAQVPNGVLLLLPLSKRLHSVFMLRLFNDGWAVALLHAAVLSLQYGMDDTAVLLFSAALSVKMSVLLSLPALLLVLVKRSGAARTLRLLFTLLSLQALLAWPFLEHAPLAYISSAFDLARVFEFRWTVNWRMLGEDLFLDKRWARGLMLGHMGALLLFAQRWCRREGGVLGMARRVLRTPWRPAGVGVVDADYIATVMFTCNLIGILFARSLHYQFYSWYAQQIPLLAWRTRYPIPVKLILIALIEYAWNVFPSTNISSCVLLGANATLLLGVWGGYPTGRSV
ncbi:ALG3 protein-domain-containing protein [Infundibulicybe gibba]|nr:ALG3 protein-domain-containing protein [Infundibulicybe gibba]